MNIQTNNTKVIFSETNGVYHVGYTVDLKDLSLQDLQKLRALTLKTYYEKLKER